MIKQCTCRVKSWALSGLLAGLLIVPGTVRAEQSETTAGNGAAEMARKLQDPLANIAAVMTDNDIGFGVGDDDIGYSFQIQPVYSFDFLEQGFTFIPRAVIPIMGVPPLADVPRLGDPRPAGGDITWGLGDIVTQFFFAPKTESGWKWGVGPQLSWRTRTDSRVGGPGWGAGAAGVVVGNLTAQLSFAGILNQLWSYDGDFSTMGFQPNLYYNLESIPGAYVAYNASISADWKANSSNIWTVPLGAVVGRTFDMGGGYGLDLSVGPYWNVIKPDGGADWFLRFGVTILFPK